MRQWVLFGCGVVWGCRKAPPVQRWDGVAGVDSAEATIAVLSWRLMKYTDESPATEDPIQVFQAAVDFLVTHFGQVRLPLGTLQRLRRGDIDLPLGGGPDVLHTTYARIDEGHLVGYQGDSFIMVVEFGPDGTRSTGIHQYGSSSRPEDVHYSDQAPLFVERQLRPGEETRVP